MDNSNVFLQPHLIHIGTARGYYDFLSKKHSLTVEQLVDVLQIYLYGSEGKFMLITENRKFEETQVTVNFCRDSDGYDIESIMKTKISAGYPVIYFGVNYDSTIQIFGEGNSKNDDKDGHFLIAYGMDENGDILLHTGWKTITYHTLSDTDYKYDKAIIWLEINKENLSHECDYNYYDVSEDRCMCACNIYYGDTHLSHTHYYLTAYGYNSAFHYKECICGHTTEIDAHNLTYLGSTSAGHTEDCIECGYISTVEHDYISYTYNLTAHTGTSACGYVSDEISHFPSSYRRSDNFNHNIYCECGHYMGSEMHKWVRSGIFYICQFCGFKQSMGDGPILLEKEDKEEIQ